MNIDWLTRLGNTTMTSQVLTHSRLKVISKMAQTTEDHISRLGIGLSIREGAVESNWNPTELGSSDLPLVVITGKSIRGKTLFKSDLPLFCALVLTNQIPQDYEDWRNTLSSHWERGVELLAKICSQENDWLRVIDSLPIS